MIVFKIYKKFDSTLEKQKWRPCCKNKVSPGSQIFGESLWRGLMPGSYICARFLHLSKQVYCPQSKMNLKKKKKWKFGLALFLHQGSQICRHQEVSRNKNYFSVCVFNFNLRILTKRHRKFESEVQTNGTSGFVCILWLIIVLVCIEYIGTKRKVLI